MRRLPLLLLLSPALCIALVLPWPVAAVTAAGAAVGAADGTVSQKAYRQSIALALELVERDEPHLAADLLVGLAAVELPGGEVMPVDHGWFVAALRAGDPDLEAVAARLAALLGELESWPPGAVAPDAFERLAAILSRPEFQSRQEPDLSPLLERLAELLDFLPDLSSLPWLGDLLVVAGLAVLAGIVAYVAVGLWGSFAAQAEVAEEGAGTEPLTAGQALSRSREMALAGDYRTAVRLLYLSTLLLLEERKVLRYDRTLTNREYLRQVADNPSLAGALRPVVDTFDEVWYGQVEPDAGGYEAYARQVDRVREEAS
jgi:hypothetical protein